MSQQRWIDPQDAAKALAVSKALEATEESGLEGRLKKIEATLEKMAEKLMKLWKSLYSIIHLTSVQITTWYKTDITQK